jgi:hypothetical protein
MTPTMTVMSAVSALPAAAPASTTTVEIDAGSERGSGSDDDSDHVWLSSPTSLRGECEAERRTNMKKCEVVFGTDRDPKSSDP